MAAIPQPPQKPPEPDPATPDLSYLHPRSIRIGSIGVFARYRAWTGADPARKQVGFVGTMVDRWNG